MTELQLNKINKIQTNFHNFEIDILNNEAVKQQVERVRQWLFFVKFQNQRDNRQNNWPTTDHPNSIKKKN